MGKIFDLLLVALGWILGQIYAFVANYGWAIILFTVLIKLLVLPLTLKQQKSMEKMQRVKPLLDHLQAKYKDDPERLNQETMKLYKKEGVSPTGGCLPLLIQFPILIGLYQVINRPLSFILNLTQTEINRLAGLATKATEGAANVTSQIGIYKGVSGVDLHTVDASLQGILQKAQALDFNFFGLDLSGTPEFMGKITWLWLIPLLAAGTAYLSTYVTKKLQGMPAQQQDSMKAMNIMMPLMSAWFCFMLPAGVGLYWVASNVVQILQTIILHYAYADKKQEVEIDVDGYFKKDRNHRKKH